MHRGMYPTKFYIRISKYQPSETKSLGLAPTTKPEFRRIQTNSRPHYSRSADRVDFTATHLLTCRPDLLNLKVPKTEGIHWNAPQRDTVIA